MSMHRVDISEPRSSESEIPEWKRFFDGQVQKGDPIWTQYLEEANEFDARMVDGWNKIVDVILVYVTLFIAILTPFITGNASPFETNPAQVTNQLLVGIYDQLQVIARTNNTTITTFDTSNIFVLDPKDYKQAIMTNALLYIALAISTVVSMVALAAKLWLVNYSRRTIDTVGSHYERAIGRQEAYNGVIEWKMMAVINTLPLLLLVALVMFGFFIHMSVQEIQTGIGYAVGTVLLLGLISLLITTLAAVYIPSCPFHSPFSACIQLGLGSLPKLYRILLNLQIPQELARMLLLLWKIKDFNLSKISSERWIQAVQIIFFLGFGTLVGYLTSDQSSNYFTLVSIPVWIVFACLAQRKTTKHKPQRYRLPLWSLCFFLVIGSFLSAAGKFSSSRKTRPIFIPLYAVGMISLLIFCWMADRLSKSLSVTGEIDAIAWLLKTTSKADSRDLLQKAGQLANSDANSGYKSRLLELLFPFLLSLIKDHTESSDGSGLEYLEAYVLCLAQLSDFKEDPGEGCTLLWEDAKWLPDLRAEDPQDELSKKLKELATDPRYDCNPKLKKAASALVDIYKLNNDQKKGSGDADSITTLTGAPHSYEDEEMELVSRRNKGYCRVDLV